MEVSKYNSNIINIFKILKILITLAVLRGMDWKRAKKETRRPLGGYSNLSKRWRWIGSGWNRYRINISILETEMKGLVMIGWIRREEG